MTGDRFQVIVWPGGNGQAPSYHVWDNQTHGEVLGRWNTPEEAKEHASSCNERERP